MPQDRETGAAGREYGLKMARGIAKCMGVSMHRAGSNEVRWQDGLAVIKSCRPATSSFGVTASMLSRLDTILAAFEDDHGEVQVWALSAAKFRAAMYDSRSAASAGGRVKMVARSYALREGRPVARFSRVELEAASRS
jgi:hypothetical protein